MDYKAFCKLNERSKKINKSKRMIYVSNVQKVNKRDCIEFLDYEVDEELIGLMPEEVYIVDYERCGGDTPFFLFEMLMSTLMVKIIACELWVPNPEAFSKVNFSEVPILPEYALIEFNYDNDDDKSAMVLVDGAIFGFFTLSDLLSKSAETDIYTQVLVNMRRFSFITLRIEDKLKLVIKKGLEEVRRDVDGVVLGVANE